MKYTDLPFRKKKKLNSQINTCSNSLIFLSGPYLCTKCKSAYVLPINLPF